jgi:peptidoglycan/LPS O-acetylase OafA/YrhL
MLAAYALVAWRPKLDRPWLCTLLALAGFGAFSWLTYDLYQPRYVMPFWPCGWQVEHRTYLALAFFVMAVASAGAHKAWRCLLANPVLAFLSTISYNLYIWHQVIARYLFQHRVPLPRTPDPHDDPTWQWQYMLLTWGVSIAFAALITYAFERPLLKRGVRAFWPRRPEPAPAADVSSAA